MIAFCLLVVLVTIIAVGTASAWFKVDPAVDTTVNNPRGAMIYEVRPDQGGQPVGELPYGFPVTLYYCLGQNGPNMVAQAKADGYTFYIWATDTWWNCGYRD